MSYLEVCLYIRIVYLKCVIRRLEGLAKEIAIDCYGNYVHENPNGMEDDHENNCHTEVQREDNDVPCVISVSM